MTTFAPTADICTYPSAIARACAALDESPIFRYMPDGYLRVVIRIVKKINLNSLFKPIHASRGTIAKESGKSIETVGRAVKWLEDAGLVTREQKARAGLRGSSAPLTPTPKLIDALTLRQWTRVAPSEDKMIRGGDHAAPSAVAYGDAASGGGSDVTTRKNGHADHAQDAPHTQANPAAEAQSFPQANRGIYVSLDGSVSTNQNLKEQSLQRQPEIAGSPEKPVTSKNTVKVGNLRIPSDLAWLVQQNGLAPTGLLSLMSQARQAGQRLSDVVAVARGYLEPLSGRRLYAYLLALVQQGKDYGYIRAKQSDERQMTRDAALDAQRVSQKAVDLVGRSYVTLDGTGTITVEPGGWLRVAKPGAGGAGMVSGTRRMDSEFVKLVDRGALKVLA